MTDWITNAQMYHSVGGGPTDGWLCQIGHRLDCYYDTAQTTNNQAVVVRSILIPANAVFDFDIVATIINDVGDKAGRISGVGTIARGSGNVFRPAVINTASVKNLGNSAIDVIANTATQSADVQVAGTTNGAGVINWHVWTLVRRGAA